MLTQLVVIGKTMIQISWSRLIGGANIL